MDTAPATPPPTVSDSEGDNMETDEEADFLASLGNNSSDDSDDGFQVPTRVSRPPASASTGQ